MVCLCAYGRIVYGRQQHMQRKVNMFYDNTHTLNMVRLSFSLSCTFLVTIIYVELTTGDQCGAVNNYT